MAKPVSRELVEFLVAVMVLLALGAALWARSDAAFASQLVAVLRRAAVAPVAGLR